MDLKDILQKTKIRSDKVTHIRKPPSIALEERPYQAQNENIKDIIEDKIETNRSLNKDKIEIFSLKNKDILETNKRLNVEANLKNRDRIKDNLKDKIETSNLKNKIIDAKNSALADLNTFSSLVGLQRRIIFFLFEECKINRIKNSKPLTIEHIAQRCNSTVSSIKKSLQRLEKKLMIIRVEYKLGRGGWTKYELPEYIYNEIIHNEPQPIYEISKRQTEDKIGSKSETKIETGSSSSSSNTYNKETTSTGSIQLPIEWEEIDLSELQKRGIRFGKTHVFQLFPFLHMYSAFEFQESLDGFIYDLDNGHIQVRRGPLNFLIGIIRNGGLYHSSHYVSPERDLMLKSLQNADARKKEQALYEIQIEEEKFQKWLQDYDQEKLIRELPTDMMVLYKAKAKEALQWIKINIFRKSQNP